MFLETIDLLNRETNYCENCNIQEQSIVINSYIKTAMQKCHALLDHIA